MHMLQCLCCSALQCVAVLVLQCVAVCCSALQCVAVHCYVLDEIALAKFETSRMESQVRVSVCCSACVAVGCRVLLLLLHMRVFGPRICVCVCV